jgi:hypothetical protein
MKYKTANSIQIILTVVVLFCLTPAISISLGQDEKAGSANAKSDGKKKDSGKKEDKKKPLDPGSLHIKVSVDSMATLPPESKIELRSDDEACGELPPRERPIRPTGVVFDNLPACKVRLRVFITGLPSRQVPVDLTANRGTLMIEIKSAGDTKVSWSATPPQEASR